MNPAVRFEYEADAEYRAAGRWYEARRVGLGLEFFDAVDATLDQIVRLPHARAPINRLPPDLPLRHAPVTRFPYHVIYLEANERSVFLPLHTIEESRATGKGRL